MNHIKQPMVVVIFMVVTCALVYASEIHDAVTANNIAQVITLLGENPSLLNVRDDNGSTPLNLAALNGNHEVASMLLDRGADISIGDTENSRPIHCAAISGNIQIVEMLLAKGATVNDQDDNGATPLIFAAGRRHLDMVRYLIEHGADVNLPSNQDVTPLFYAGTPEIAGVILDNGANINARTNEGATPLHNAVWRGRTEMVRFLLERGANPNSENQEGQAPLWEVNGENAFQIASLLIENSARVDFKDNENSTPLHAAASIGSLETAELLISKGADINAKDNFGWTPLCMAAMYSAEITKYLLSRGADVNPHVTEMKEGCPRTEFPTPLHCAVRSDSISTVKLLVENGALVNMADENGWSHLHLAVDNCNFEIVDYLISKGAYLNLKEDKYGRTEMHTAVIKGQGQLIDRLIEAGARIDIKDNEGKTPLDYARYHGFSSVAEMLETQKAPAAKYSATTPDILNNKRINEKEAIVWYLGHSGWAIKTQNHLLIFDYFEHPTRALPSDASLAGGFIIPSEIKNENVMVFVSHDHGDHYDSRIFEWRSEIPDIDYVLGFRPRDTDQEYIFTAPRSEQRVGDVVINATRSNDTGAGFLIEVDGLTILHPGDHANGSIDMSGNYTPEIDALATMNKNIDLSFFAILGCRLGTPESVQLGVHYAIEHLRPRVLFPMHAGPASYVYREFVEAAADRNYDTQLVYALNEGDRFLYRHGKIAKIE